MSTVGIAELGSVLKRHRFKLQIGWGHRESLTSCYSPCQGLGIAPQGAPPESLVAQPSAYAKTSADIRVGERRFRCP